LSLHTAGGPGPADLEASGEVLQGDARQVLQRLPDGTVDVCVTSPPYWSLRDYHLPSQIGLEPTPDEYVEQLVKVFREVRRVLKPGRTLWLNLGDTYYSGKGRCDEPGGNARSHHPRGLPPNRRPGIPGLKPKDLVGIPWRVALALQKDGWVLRNAVIWHKSNAMPTSIQDRLANRYEFVFVLANSPQYKFNLDAIREHYSPSTLERVSCALRRETEPRQERRSRALEPHRLPEPGCATVLHALGKNPGDVWSIAHASSRSDHHATFPAALAERAIKAGSDEGDLVLDPFCGSGTTLKVAEQLGRRSVGIDLAGPALCSRG